LAQMDGTQLPDTDNDSQDTDGLNQPLQPEQITALDKQLTYTNLAEGMDKKDLDKIGCDVIEGFKTDDESRREWLDRNREYMKLATQVVERKSYPWDGAANVKYPLLTTAALQFSARAYGSLIPSMDVVKAKVVGDDPQGQMTDIANKLSTHMSYQLLYEIEDWEEDMDKLCFILPIIGTMFKKIWVNADKEICIDLFSPKHVVVNYYTKQLCNAPRISEIQYYTVNEIKEMMNKKQWLESPELLEAGTPDPEDQGLSDGRMTGVNPPKKDDETPRKFITQYCRLDLDDDEYKEPYIVTVDYEKQQVVRIVANFYSKDIEWQDPDTKKKVACIHPAEWFVKYDFLPNPDGGFYGIGFGILLGGINNMINTICNQLIDSATLSNLQAGFIGRGLRDNRQKTMKFSPGEWKWVNNPGDDLKKNIFPLPVREPSSTLFQLLGTLVQSGKEVASVAEIFTGKMPGQNTPAQTTMATIEQGLKVFTSIYKRMYRSMGKEFCMLFELDKLYAPAQPVVVSGQINGEDKSYSVSKFDYQKALVKIIPSADPNMVSETQKLLKIQGLYELMQYGTINAQEMTRQALTYQGQSNITGLMQVSPPGPPPDVQVKMQQIQSNEKIEQQKLQIEQQKLQMQAAQQQADLMVAKSTAILNLAKAKQADAQDSVMQLEMQLEMITKQQELLHSHQEAMQKMGHQMMQHKLDQQTQENEMAMSDKQHKQDLVHNTQLHQQDLVHKERLNQAVVEAAKAKAAVQRSSSAE
jgi:chaperonin GroES